MAVGDFEGRTKAKTERAFVATHPSRKNKNPVRVGHPDIVVTWILW